MKNAIIILLLLFPLSLAAQVTDDFADGDFTNNPTWSGCDTSFKVNASFQLQLNASTAGTSWLSTPISESHDTEWRFWIREAFSPSANNFTDVFLCTDNSNPTQATQGYFLRFGESGSSDAIELFRKDGSTVLSICRGTEATIATSFAVAVKVICDSMGNWTLQTCYDNSGVYGVEAQGHDDTYSHNGYFAFLATYTSSNAQKIYLDDVYIGQPIIDNDPPTLLSADVADNHHLRLVFSEAVSEETALILSNYTIDNNIGNPDSANFGENHSTVELQFDMALANGIPYTIEIRNISDLAGNIMATTQAHFSYYEAEEYDVVINEIMADPTPVVGLPEWEYVELYNTTEHDINLEGWRMVIGSSELSMESHLLPAHEYLILCHNNAVAELSDYGDCMGFSSFSITNSSSNMNLYGSNGTLVSHAGFTTSWYHDPDKAEGGWAVEQIDPQNPCAGASNWTASTDNSGGTPGRLNSVDAPNETKPKIDRISMFSDHIVQLWFDQQMNQESMNPIANYKVTETGAFPQQVNTNPIDPTFVELIFSNGFEQGIIYTLEVKDLVNCMGNAIEDGTTARFGIPDEAESGDIVINEILFDPIAPGVDYVEIYNNSDKTLDINGLLLGVISQSFPNPADTTLKVIAESSRLFLPATYILLSANGEIVGQQYECSTENFVDMASFPSYANSGGTAILTSLSGAVIDQMTFSEDMHYPLIKETKGVALERVSFDTPSNDADNWHSAAESVHFGTPGYENSMAQSLVPSNDAITIEPEIFSPDGDAHDDGCMIGYNFDNAGYTMNIYIFNVDGQLLRHLVKGELVGKEGAFPWNGLDDNGNRVPLGICVIVTEVFDMDGTMKRFKNSVVVATR